MKSTDRAFLIALPVLALIAGFWFLLLAPKRQEAQKLGDQVAELREQVDGQRAVAAAAEQAQARFAGNYRRLVGLGKAVPADSDTSSFFVQLTDLAQDADVDFRALKLEGSGGAPPATPAAQTTTDQNAEQGEAGGDDAAASEGGTPTSASTAAPAPATEASAALAPLGASVGPAGLATMPYALEFKGDFFALADFLDGLDRMVRTRHNGMAEVDGRLLTVNGFTLAPDEDRGLPHLEAALAVTTYLTPDEQGLTAGASPQGPAPSAPGGDPAPTPTSATP